MPDFAAWSRAVQARMESALESCLPAASLAPERLHTAMRYVTLGGGKRVRPMLAFAAGEAVGGEPGRVEYAACAGELIHVYSLTHDDLPCMDDDDLRRGKPTVHKAFDEATAVLAGDALQANAFYALAEPDTHPDPYVRAELCRCLARAAGPRGMCGGQMLDMLAEEAGEPLEEAEIGRLQLLKTGKLIEFSAEAGAILGKAPPQLRHALAAYGRDLGAAFQIADDLLDATVSAAEAGKRTGKDAEAGKATLVGLLGIPRARAHAERLAAQAAGHLDALGERADLLRALADYAIARRT